MLEQPHQFDECRFRQRIARFHDLRLAQFAAVAVDVQVSAPTKALRRHRHDRVARGRPHGGVQMAPNVAEPGSRHDDPALASGRRLPVARRKRRVAPDQRYVGVEACFKSCFIGDGTVFSAELDCVADAPKLRPIPASGSSSRGT